MQNLLVMIDSSNFEKKNLTRAKLENKVFFVHSSFKGIKIVKFKIELGSERVKLGLRTYIIYNNSATLSQDSYIVKSRPVIS